MPLIWKYSEDARKIIENVYKFCVEEKQSGLKMPLERAWDRTAALTGVSRATAQRILTKKVELPSPLIDQAATVSKVTLDDFDQGVARRTIAGMYAQKKMLPTLENIHAELKQSIGYTGSKETLRKELKKIKFSYSRCEVNRKVLMERQDVVLSRIRYLRRIKELREQGYNIVYTDETYVHTSHVASKCWQDSSVGIKIPFSKGEWFILYDH